MNKDLRLLLLSIPTILCIISSSSFWSLWISLEMFNFLMVPWLIDDKNLKKNSMIFFYFVIQAVSSSMMILCVFNMDMMISSYLLNLAVLMKIGGFPCHHWVFLVVEKMSWNKFSFFMSIGKIAPLSFYALFAPPMGVVKFLLGGVFIPLMGMKSVSIRKMLTYSSIAHISWMLVCMKFSLNLFFLYTLFYWVAFVMLCMMMKNYKINSIKDISHCSEGVEIISILTLMGTPPFLGFFPKMFFLKILCANEMMVEAIILSISSILPFYYYLKMMLHSQLSYGFINSSLFYTKLKKKIIWSVVLIILSLETLSFLIFL